MAVRFVESVDLHPSAPGGQVITEWFKMANIILLPEFSSQQVLGPGSKLSKKSARSLMTVRAACLGRVSRHDILLTL